jgi:hypothetical protein
MPAPRECQPSDFAPTLLHSSFDYPNGARISALEISAAKMDFNKTLDVGSGSQPISSFVTLMDNVSSDL